METIKLVYPVEGGDMIEAGEASSKMKLTLKKLGCLPPACPVLIPDNVLP